jgi:hypothetical protein
MLFKHTYFLAFILMSLISHRSFAQRSYTLPEVVQIAQGQSLDALVAKNLRENRFWQYRTYLSDFKPRLLLNGTLPDFSRAIIQNRNDDGSIGFIDVSNINANLNLSLSQVITATGGEIFVSSSLARLQNLSGIGIGTQWSSDLMQVGFRQPLFNFNEFKWDKKIEPIRYQESTKRYNEDMEGIALGATRLFFNLLDAQIAYQIAEKNVANNDTIFKIGQGRYNLGKIAENDLLQLKLNLMNSSQQLTQARLDIETGQLALKAFLGNSEDLSQIKLIAPTETPILIIDPKIAMEQAKANREQFLRFKRQALEAERDVARARGESGLNVNMFATLGFTDRGTTLTDAYNTLQDQQSVQIGFQVPILDWGRQKARIQTAIANQELVNSTVQQEELNFEQDVYLKVKQFDILRDRLLIGKESDEIADRRYFIAQKRYLIAKISITDLNIALQEKDIAKRSYLATLRDYWQSYYQIRQLTMYDFERGEVITY